MLKEKKGWMSERFCHYQWLFSEKYSDGYLASTWFCLMPWASGSVIDGLSGDYWDKCFKGEYSNLVYSSMNSSASN